MSKRPPHPGDYVWTELLQPRRLTITAAAELLGVSQFALSALLNKHSDLSPLMALRLEKVFGEKMETILNMQAIWDAAKVRKTSKDLVLHKYRDDSVVFERVGKRGGPRLRVLTPGERSKKSSTD